MFSNDVIKALDISFKDTIVYRLIKGRIIACLQHLLNGLFLIKNKRMGKNEAGA
jgi:hypothetical protein